MSVNDAAFLITVFGLMGIFSRIFMTSLSAKVDREAVFRRCAAPKQSSSGIQQVS